MIFFSCRNDKKADEGDKQLTQNSLDGYFLKTSQTECQSRDLPTSTLEDVQVRAWPSQRRFLVFGISSLFSAFLNCLSVVIKPLHRKMHTAITFRHHGPWLLALSALLIHFRKQQRPLACASRLPESLSRTTVSPGLSLPPSRLLVRSRITRSPSLRSMDTRLGSLSPQHGEFRCGDFVRHGGCVQFQWIISFSLAFRS